jgi:hypothetical protein
MRGRISTDNAPLRPLRLKASLNKYMLIAVVIKTFPKIFTKLRGMLFYFFIIVKRIKFIDINCFLDKKYIYITI